MASRFVLDASVAAKWFLVRDESDLEAAARLRRAALYGEADLHAPAVLPYEVGNLLSTATRSKPPRLKEDAAADSIRQFFGVPIRLHASCEEDAVEALAMAIKFSKTFYDMTYLHLAEKLDCKLCTADERAARSTHDEFPSDRIVLLSEL